LRASPRNQRRFTASSPGATTAREEFRVVAPSLVDPGEDVSAALRFRGAGRIQGFSARLASKARPSAPIIALTPLDSTCRRLTIAWGVMPVMVPHWRTADRMVELGIQQLLKKKLVRRGDWVVAMAGTTTRAGGTNLLRILHVGRRQEGPIPWRGLKSRRNSRPHG